MVLKTSLKDHQVEGLGWLQQSWARGLRGVLLADDMGLGKTLQALTFLAWLRQAMGAGKLPKAPLLIVAPTGLLKNWEQEHELHLHKPGLGKVVRAFGRELAAIKMSKGRETDLGQATLDGDCLSKADWVLTTYETLRDYQHSFCSVRYSAVVFDEMQKVKTPGIVMTDAAKALNAHFFVGMTGTPVETRLADLWCLVDTLEPGLLGDLSIFSRTYEKDVDHEKLKSLKSKLVDPTPEAPQLMLRRMKVDKLPGLPPKIEHNMVETMTGAQAELYDEAIKAARVGGGGSKMLQTLQALRSISLHPFHPQTATDDSYADQSARFRMMTKALDQISARGEKALIFVESREMQPYLATFLQRRYRLRNLPMLISGEVSGDKRQERVNLFQKAGAGFDVILLSPRAGGVGITLTAANHVIHLSRWWNPAIEDQCTDRVYRMGQKAKEVHVYYPMAVHPTYGDQSFDQRLDALLNRRRSLSRELLLPPVDPDDAKDLFQQTVGGGGEVGTVELASIDAMEPVQFERWVLHKLLAAGHRANETPTTRDGGADGIVFHRDGGRPFILQCKHTQRNGSPDAAIADLVRAKGAYSALGGQIGLVAVTNAQSFGRAASEAARAVGITLVCRDKLGSWPSSFPA
jgi:SNF2 family DNA or RNA helicase